jgi:hypothetical protein
VANSYIAPSWQPTIGSAGRSRMSWTIRGRAVSQAHDVPSRRPGLHRLRRLSGVGPPEEGVNQMPSGREDSLVTWIRRGGGASSSRGDRRRGRWRRCGAEGVGSCGSHTEAPAGGRTRDVAWSGDCQQPRRFEDGAQVFQRGRARKRVVLTDSFGRDLGAPSSRSSAGGHDLASRRWTA